MFLSQVSTQLQGQYSMKIEGYDKRHIKLGLFSDLCDFDWYYNNVDQEVKFGMNFGIRAERNYKY